MKKVHRTLTYTYARWRRMRAAALGHMGNNSVSLSLTLAISTFVLRHPLSDLSPRAMNTLGGTSQRRRGRKKKRRSEILPRRVFVFLSRVFRSAFDFHCPVLLLLSPARAMRTSLRAERPRGFFFSQPRVRCFFLICFLGLFIAASV